MIQLQSSDLKDKGICNLLLQVYFLRRETFTIRNQGE
jgi:hypothetical protein